MRSTSLRNGVTKINASCGWAFIYDIAHSVFPAPHGASTTVMAMVVPSLAPYLMLFSMLYASSNLRRQIVSSLTFDRLLIHVLQQKRYIDQNAIAAPRVGYSAILCATSQKIL